MLLHLRSALICLALVVPFAAPAQAPTEHKAVPTVNPATEIPKFYAESRQIIVEAEVWNRTSNKADLSSVEHEPLRPDEKDLLRHKPPPARGLKAQDFHLFDNGVQQSINYFKESDFPGVDITGQWRFVPIAQGTWGTLQNFTDSAFEPPSATYLIGYAPPSIRPGECHTIRIVVQHYEVQLNRNQYCSPNSSDSPKNDALEGTELVTRMRKFADSSAHGSINVAMQAFAFWSSGVLSLASEGSQRAAPMLGEDINYVVEVHDSKAPATVQIAANFALPTRKWDYPCSTNDQAIHVLGISTGRMARLRGSLATPLRALRSFPLHPR